MSDEDTCVRCNGPSAGICCSSHNKSLCHRCYRRTHFVEVCVPNCAPCAREGLSTREPITPKYAMGGIITAPDAESTSAALRRAEQERDEANELCDKVAAELRLVTRERDSLARRCALRFEERDLARAELVSVRQELSGHFGRASALGAEVMELRANVRARDEALVSAQQELDAVRTARDNLGRQLALAHREVLELDAQIKLCPRCGVQLAAEVAAEMGEATE